MRNPLFIPGNIVYPTYNLDIGLERGVAVMVVEDDSQLTYDCFFGWYHWRWCNVPGGHSMAGDSFCLFCQQSLPSDFEPERLSVTRRYEGRQARGVLADIEITTRIKLTQEALITV